MTQIASQIDGDLIANVKYFHNWVGTYGNTISTVAGFFAAPQRLDEMAVPMSDRNAVLTPNDGYALAGTFTGLAALAGDTAAQRPAEGEDPDAGQHRALHHPDHPVAHDRHRVQATGTTVNGASQNVTYASSRTTYTQSLITATGSGKTFKAGEKFTIANVYACNPRTKAQMTYLKQFTVHGRPHGLGHGAATLTISPPIITSGAYQNCVCTGTDTTAPDTGAADRLVRRALDRLQPERRLPQVGDQAGERQRRRAPTPGRATSRPTPTPASASATGATRTAPTTCTTIVGTSTTAPRTWTRASARSCSAPSPPPETGRA
jgi:hypothetical protein